MSIQGDNKEHQKEIFASVYLTLVGIIQATVYTKISYDSFSYLHRHGKDVVSTLISSAFWFNPTTAFYIATLATVVVVTFEYIYFAATARRIIRSADVISIFVLGFCQVWMASAVETANYSEWWLASAAFAVAGVYAYSISLASDWNRIYDGDGEKVLRQRRHLIGRLCLTTIALVTSLGVVWASYQPWFSTGVHWLLAIAYGLGWGLTFMSSGDAFAVRQQTSDTT